MNKVLPTCAEDAYAHGGYAPTESPRTNQARRGRRSRGHGEACTPASLASLATIRLPRDQTTTSHGG